MTQTASEHEETALASPRRFGLRRGRLQPGPLSAVRRRRAIAWQIPAAFVVALAAAGSATAYLAVHPAPPAVAEPAVVETVASQEAPVAETAALRPSTDASTASAPAAPVLPAPSIEEARPSHRAEIAPEPAVAAPAHPERGPAPEVPSFQLSSLPVLEADEASLGLDPIAAEPARPAAKPAPRRSAATTAARPKASGAPSPVP